MKKLTKFAFLEVHKLLFHYFAILLLWMSVLPLSYCVLVVLVAFILKFKITLSYFVHGIVNTRSFVSDLNC